jgi:hypothetical protein
VFEKEKVNCTSRVWAGDEYCGEVAFKDISLDSTQINVPFTFFYKSSGGAGAGSDSDGKLLFNSIE